MHYKVIGRGKLFTPMIELLDEHKFAGYYDDNQVQFDQYSGQFSAIDWNFKGAYFLAFASIKSMAQRELFLKELHRHNLLKINAISKKAAISRSVELGFGNVICANVSLAARVKMGSGCIVFSNTVLEHDCVLGDNVNMAPGVSVAGSVKIGDNVFIGVGSSIKDGVTIGNNSVIGAGSVILSDVAPNCVYYGYPAKFAKENDLYRPAILPQTA